MKLRRVVSFLLILCLLVTQVIPAVAAQETAEAEASAEIVDSGSCGALGSKNNVTWTLDSEGVLTVSGEGKMRDYFPGWKKHRESIEKVIIEDGVTHIGESAFYLCENLVSAELPESVKSIGSYAFSVCLSLKKITIPQGVTRIEKCTFAACDSLKSVTVPEKLSYIGDSAFEGCKALKSIHIPASVEKIKANAFERTGLQNIFFEGEAPSIGLAAFGSVYANVWYDLNATWTDETRLNYGGDLTWEEIKPLEIITPPKRAYAKLGEIATVSVEAEGNGLSYTWSYRDDPVPQYKNSTVSNGDTYEIEMNPQRHIRRVRCTIRDVHGNKVRTEVVTLRLAATITTQPEDVTVKQGETAEVSLKAVGDELTYTWYYKKPGASEYTKAKSFTGTSYSVKMTDKLNGLEAYCVVEDRYGKTDKSDVVTLSME